MGTILGTAIALKARTVLQDSKAVRWLDPEALGWINEGQRYICLHRPDASTMTGNLTLVAGTKQTIVSGERLADVVRNMGLDGNTPGVPIRIVEREQLDVVDPGWHSKTASSSIRHVMYDDRNPSVYYCYPPATAGTRIEAIRHIPPANLPTIGSAITLDDVYEPVLVDYLLYRCEQKEAEYAGNPTRYLMHFNLVNSQLGLKSQVDLAVSPRAQAK